MRRTIKVKALSTRVPLRKTAMTVSAISRRPFPAWIVDDAGTAFTARGVSHRVRAGLVLREVSMMRRSGAKRSTDAHGTE